MNSALPEDSSSSLEHPMPSNVLPAGHGLDASLTQNHVPSVNTPAESTPAPPLVENDCTVISQRPVAAPAEFIRSLSLIELAKTLEGRSLDHFSVERMIGGGGMGAVFRGRDLRLNRDVAIKVIPESKRDPETLRRFRMEAQSAAKLDHPNIARVFDIGEDETWNYIVFEFIDGINLRDLVLMNGPMTVDDAVFTTRQVAEALQHAHDRDVVHRDIKPSNVIITPNGIAKVVDMGLARNTAMDRSTADQTASGVTLGTFDYISPEQARDPRDADVRSDLYSLGCTLFYMLTGQPPFPDGTAIQKLLNHGSQPPPDPRGWRDDISDQLVAVLLKLMAKRPSDRYQKPLELINDLMLIAQIESLPRSGTAGTILLTPAIAQRSLLELHLPWLLPLCALIGSVFWLQSADSFSSPIEVPQPVLKSAGRFQPVATPSTEANNPERARSNSNTSRKPDNSLEADDRSGNGLIEPATSPKIADQVPPAVAKNPPTGLPSDAERSTFPATIDPSDRITPERMTAEPRDQVVRSDNGEPSLKSENNGPVAALPTAETNSIIDEDNRVEAGSPLSSNLEAASRSPVAAPAFVPDVIVVSEQSVSSSRWAPTLPAALMQAAMSPEIRTIELHDSIELTSPVTLPRSGLTLRSATGMKAEITLTGSDAFGMGWESWIEVDRKTLRCQGLRIHCLNDMRQPQAIFAMRAGGKVELEDCMITMASSRDSMAGNCILIKDSAKANGVAAIAPGGSGTATSPLMPTTSATPATLMPPTLMPTTSAASVTPMPSTTSSSSEPVPTVPSTSTSLTSPSDEVEPVTVSLRNTVVRGALSMITMRAVCRAEITMDNVCAMVEGRVLTIRAEDDRGVPPVVRMNLQRSTLVSLQGFAAIQAAAATRAPLVLMRTAKLCAFWSPTATSHLAIDGIADQEILDKLLLLRGEENAYDINIENLAQCRLTDGQHIQFRLNDLSGEWFRELGYENNLRWQNAIPPERPMDQQLPSDYQLKDSMYMPGYR